MLNQLHLYFLLLNFKQELCLHCMVTAKKLKAVKVHCIVRLQYISSSLETAVFFLFRVQTRDVRQ